MIVLRLTIGNIISNFEFCVSKFNCLCYTEVKGDEPIMKKNCDNQFRHKQIQAIKARLDSALNKAGWNAYQLTNEINDMPDSLGANYNTIKSALNFSSDAIDLTAVISICRCLHLDTAYILSPPGTADLDFSSAQSDMGKFTVLDDPKYFGIFHGFLYTANHKSTDLVRFKLDIKHSTTGAHAAFTYYAQAKTVNGEVKSSARTLYGTPVFDSVHSNIFIQLTNDLGDFYFLYYTRQHFRTQSLYFRRGISITATSLHSHAPLLQNFVMFANPISEEKMKYIPGLLAEVSPVFRISQPELEKLMNEEPIVSAFYKAYQHILEHDAVRTYPISETQILSSISPSMDEYDTIRALLLLKSVSSASKRVVYDELESFSAFSKNYLQQPGNSELPH